MLLVAAVDEDGVGVEVLFLRLPHEEADIAPYPDFNQKQGNLIFNSFPDVILTFIYKTSTFLSKA
jgi:hypothetical protein